MCILQETDGFSELVTHFKFADEVKKFLPNTLDRFSEARFFAHLAANIDAEISFSQEITWLTGAYLAAMVSIRDAAHIDFKKIDKVSKFDESDIAKEFFLPTNSANRLDCDPLGINRAFRNLRNLRVHYSIPLVVLEPCVLLVDVGADKRDIFRWFLRPLDPVEQTWLSRGGKNGPLLETNEITRFNEWLIHKTLSASLYQHLLILAVAINSTALSLVNQKVK